MSSIRRLDDVCELVMGQAPSGEAYNTEGKGWPLIAGAGDFGETTPQPTKFTTEATRLSRIGDIVLGIRASIGEKVVADGEYCLGRGVAGLRPREMLNSRFLWHWLGQVAPRLTAKAKGATFKQVSKQDIGELPISLPPLAEQQRIADLLDRAEALRAKRRASLAQLDTYIQSTFLDLFGDPASNPHNWPRVELGELLVTGPQNGLYKPSTDYGSGVPILRIDAFYDGEVTKLAALKRVRISDEERDLYALHAGDIVVNRVNSMEYLGKSALIPRLDEPTVFESNMMRFEIDLTRAEPRYIVQFLQSAFVKGQILTAAKDAVNQSSVKTSRASGLTFRLFLSSAPSFAVSMRCERLKLCSEHP
jgi:type I restriction enzyme, S subunit